MKILQLRKKGTCKMKEFKRIIGVGLSFALLFTLIVFGSTSCDKDNPTEPKDESWSYDISASVVAEFGGVVGDPFVITKIRSREIKPEGSEAAYYYELVNGSTVKVQQIRSRAEVSNWTDNNSEASFKLGYIGGGVTGGTFYTYPYTITSSSKSTLKEIYNKIKNEE